jgi:hypothetical protein
MEKGMQFWAERGKENRVEERKFKTGSFQWV